MPAITKAQVPSVEITPDPARITPAALCRVLQYGDPAIAVDPAGRDRGVIIVNPMCLKPGEAEIVGQRIAHALA